MTSFIKNALPLFILTLALILFLSLDLQQYFTFQTWKQYRHEWLSWTHQHYWQAILIFILIYTFSVAISFPGAAFLSIVAGFLFGYVAGTLCVLISATLGAYCIFIAVKLALSPWLKKRMNAWADKMARGFKRNAFQYLLFLRLVPIFPFWIVNLAAGLFDVKTSTFLTATLLGITPAVIIYVSLGKGLGAVLDKNQTPNLSVIFEPQLFFPLLALGCVALLTIIFKKRRF